MQRIPFERFAGRVPTPFAVYRPPIIGLGSVSPVEIGIGHADGAGMLSAEQVTDLVKGAVAEAIKAINPPDPAQVPGQSTKAVGANVNLKKHSPFPVLYKAMKGAHKGFNDDAAYERDFAQAAKEALGYRGADDDTSEGSIIWPTNARQAAKVFELMSERGAEKSMDRIDTAMKAMTEALTTTVSGGTAGGLLVPAEFAQSLFGYALAPEVALRRVPGVRTYNATSNIVFFPRETTRAGASQASEAGTLTSADATLAQQSVTVEKQYAFRRWSSELARDAQPAFSEFLSNTVVRDLAIQQDIQYLRGTGSTPQITGILNYSSLTSGPSLGANGRTPKADDFLDADYLLQAVNARGADFVIYHPRTENSLRKEKDNVARYLTSVDGRPTVAPYPIAGYLPAYKTNNLLITQTVGGSTDCSTAIIGDSSQIYIVERQGIELAFSEHLYFATDELAVRAIARSTIVIIQPAAVELVTGIRA